MGRFTDLVGQRFNRLVVVKKEPHVPGEVISWVCACDCGNETHVRGGNLKNGSVKSCGCLHREVTRARITHGQSRSGQHTPEYSVWEKMIQRCRNASNPRHKNHAGRGIEVCERWRKFENFFADMGERPSLQHSIDRWPDNDGNYEKSNCRWATAEEQARNRRSNVMVEFRGREMPLVEAAELSGLPYPAVWARVSTLGWSIDRALSVPVTLGRNQYD